MRLGDRIFSGNVSVVEWGNEWSDRSIMHSVLWRTG